jgi:hypothetical protein
MKKVFGKDHWSYKHGLTVGNTRTAEYSAYQNARQRCTNPRAVNYSYYGGRGIEFRFTSFDEFYEALGPRPSAQHGIERVDNERHYEQGKVRWATRVEQQNNVRRNSLLTANGESHTQAEWARRSGIRAATLIRRRKLGWCDQCVVTLPIRPGVKQTCRCLKDLGENA